VKATTRAPRASHVNAGTSIPSGELAWPKQAGRVCRLPKTHVEVDARSEVTPYGGLGLFSGLAQRLRIAECIDEKVTVLKAHRPFHESDHVLAIAANLFVGGMCLEDQANLQHSEAVRRVLGAVRIPDPTTAGDFLRRFDEGVTVGSLSALRDAIDKVGERAARAIARRRKKLATATIDLDGHYKLLYGAQKEGADFNYKYQWSHHPLVASLAETGECLAIVNRPGNARSSDGAAEVTDRILPLVRERAARILVRGDSDFDRQDLRDTCKKHGAYVALVGRAQTGRPEIARAIPEHAYRIFQPRARREKLAREHERRPRRRRRRANLRRQRAAERRYKELRLVQQQIAEVSYRPPGSEYTYRLIVRRQVIENREGQQHLFDQYRYRYVITDLPGPAEAVIDETYLRCDQENVIEQLGSGLAAWRMPVGEFAGNSAWLEIARLAWNIGKWIALLALPDETVRWEWKRFRAAFVFVAAQVLVRSRQVTIRISASHRWHRTFVAAHQSLQL
jgi:Transposase DDE domain group 1